MWKKRNFYVSLLKTFPDWTMPDLSAAEQFTQQVTGKLVIVNHEVCMILHAWSISPTAESKGEVLALCATQTCAERRW